MEKGDGTKGECLESGGTADGIELRNTIALRWYAIYIRGLD